MTNDHEIRKRTWISRFMQQTCMSVVISFLLLFLGSFFHVVIAETTTTTPQQDRLHRLPLRRIPLPTTTTPASTNCSIHTLRHRNAYCVRTTARWTVEVPNSSHLERVSHQAPRHGCVYATNGGPYYSDAHGGSSSMGPLMVNGTWIVPPPPARSRGDDDDVGVGIGRTATEVWIGPLGQQELDDDDDGDSGLTDFVTGFDWLVYEGASVARMNNTPGVRRAPRTAAGVDAEGRLLLVVVDGCEWCLRHQGLTVEELADLLVHSYGAQYALTLDGGGSSVLVQGGHVLSHPVEGLWPHERPVASIVCVHKGDEATARAVGPTEPNRTPPNATKTGRFKEAMTTTT